MIRRDDPIEHSLDSAVCDFFVFPNMKKWLGAKWFTSNEAVIAKNVTYFAKLGNSYYLDGSYKT